MQNLITYAEAHLDPFHQRPPGSVDSLILSWVANLHFPPEVHTWAGLPLRDLFRAELFPTLFQGIWDPERTKTLFTALAASPRFREVRLMGYTTRTDLDQEMQFTAVTFQLRPDLCYVAFGGTDTSLVGWKENFNMTFLSPVPAQTQAARYLTQAASHCAGDLLVGGHSKGGNLAVYAAAVSTDIQARIRRVYSHDGPGFPKTFLASPGYGAVRDRVEKTVPQDSVVGLLLENETCQIIQSSRRMSLLQHDPFSWMVEGNGFLPAEALSDEARFWDRTLDGWADRVPPQEREGFFDALYDILTAAKADSLGDLADDIPALLGAARNLDPETRGLLRRTFRALGASLRKARKDEG